jgi:hypothetical protein
MGNWTYFPTKLTTSPKDFIRFLIGDTVYTDQQLQDEEINAAIGFFGTNYLRVAGQLCQTLATKFSRSVDQAAGQAKAQYSQMAKAYADRAEAYLSQASAFATPYAGGISIADMLNNLQNTDRPDTAFAMGLTDNWLPIAPAGNETTEQAAPGSSVGGGLL